MVFEKSLVPTRGQGKPWQGREERRGLVTTELGSSRDDAVTTPVVRGKRRRSAAPASSALGRRSPAPLPGFLGYRRLGRRRHRRIQQRPAAPLSRRLSPPRGGRTALIPADFGEAEPSAAVGMVVCYGEDAADLAGVCVSVVRRGSQPPVCCRPGGPMRARPVASAALRRGGYAQRAKRHWRPPATRRRGAPSTGASSSRASYDPNEIEVPQIY